MYSGNINRIERVFVLCCHEMFIQIFHAAVINSHSDADNLFVSFVLLLAEIDDVK